MSILPTIFGEKAVLRILDKDALQLDLTKLGFDPWSFEKFGHAIHQPYGMVLITGPTGSGKTTTLYSAISTINAPEHNIMTAEDPVEYNLKGVNQVQVNEGIGRTFAAVLRSFLRQDPDVILVGETRDLETAQIGIRAALTGHLVFTTLHTNDCPSTVARLVDMGVPPFLLSSALLAHPGPAARAPDLQGLQGAVRGARRRPGAVRPRLRGPRQGDVLQGQGLPDLQLHGHEGPRRALRGDADHRGAAHRHPQGRADGGDPRDGAEPGHEDPAPGRPHKVLEGTTTVEEVLRVTLST